MLLGLTSSVEKPPQNTCVQEENGFLPAAFSNPSLFGWRVRCTVTGPGCVYRDRGIWIRRGVFPRAPVAGLNVIRHRIPVLRYTVHISIDFDKVCLPFTGSFHSACYFSQVHPL